MGHGGFKDSGSSTLRGGASSFDRIPSPHDSRGPKVGPARFGRKPFFSIEPEFQSARIEFRGGMSKHRGFSGPCPLMPGLYGPALSLSLARGIGPRERHKLIGSRNWIGPGFGPLTEHNPIGVVIDHISTRTWALCEGLNEGGEKTGQIRSHVHVGIAQLTVEILPYHEANPSDDVLQLARWNSQGWLSK